MNRYPGTPAGTREVARDNDEPRRGATWDEMGGNRKLIRPSLTDIAKEPAGAGPGRDPGRDSWRGDSNRDRDPGGNRGPR